MNRRGLMLAILVSIVCFGCGTGYQKEGGVVYFKYWNEANGAGKRRLDADAATFEVLKYDAYAKDKKSVFYNGGLIANADAATFVALGALYAKDKNRAYYMQDSIKSSTGASFKIIDNYYSTDGRDVFYATDPLHMANPANFRFVYSKSTDNWENWTTDGKYYYYQQYKIPSDDYRNLKIFPNSCGLAKDKQWVYFLDHKLNYDIEGKKVVDTIDAASFQVKGFIDCSDRYGCFNVYHGRQPCNQ